MFAAGRAIATALILMGLLLALPAASAETESATVAVAEGLLAGEEAGQLRVFRGIPFASPPVGQLRWRPPEPPMVWEGVREARAFAPAWFQSAHPVMNVPGQPVSEDCLYLNVWEPAAKGGSARLSKDEEIINAAWRRDRNVWFAANPEDPHVIAIEVIT